MFSTTRQLARKTGPDGIGRYDFLKSIVEEFKKTVSFQAKREVLANLANFAYDPINFEHLRRLQVLDLFLEQLSQDNEDLLHFGLAGLCNLAPDPDNGHYIVKLNGIFLISQQLLHDNEDIALNALTTLIFLCNLESHESIATPEIIAKVLLYLDKSDPRFKTLANVFLQDFCTSEQIAHAKANSSNTHHDSTYLT